MKINKECFENQSMICIFAGLFTLYALTVRGCKSLRIKNINTFDMKKVMVLALSSLFFLPFLFGQKSNKDNLYACSHKRQWGFCDSRGNVIIPQIYEKVTDIKDGCAWVKQNDKWGRINTDQEVKVNLVYEEYKEFSPGLFALRKGGKWGLVNGEGTQIIDHKYDLILAPDNGMMAVCDGPVWGVVNIKGDEIVPMIFAEVGRVPGDPHLFNVERYFDEGMIRANIGTRWGIFNEKGEEVVPLTYDFIGTYSHGLAQASMDKKAGYLNKFGKIAIPFQFEIAQVFPDKYDVTMAKKGGKWGMIDVSGKNITPFKYSVCNGNLRNGYVFVKEGDKTGKLNILGQETWNAPREIKVVIPKDEKPKEEVKMTVSPPKAEEAVKENEPKTDEPETKTAKTKKGKKEKAPKKEKTSKAKSGDKKDDGIERKHEFDAEGNEIKKDEKGEKPKKEKKEKTKKEKVKKEKTKEEKKDK